MLPPRGVVIIARQLTILRILIEEDLCGPHFVADGVEEGCEELERSEVEEDLLHLPAQSELIKTSSQRHLISEIRHQPLLARDVVERIGCKGVLLMLRHRLREERS